MSLSVHNKNKMRKNKHITKLFRSEVFLVEWNDLEASGIKRLSKATIVRFMSHSTQIRLERPE